ncbi:hypothetical protein ACS0TY_000415 [Phlomoides rotata]
MEKGKSIRREHQHTRGNPKDKKIPKKHDRRVETEHSISSETDSESEFVFKSRSRSSKSMHSSLSPGKIDLVEPALKKGEIYYRSILRTAINEITALRYDDEQLRELQRTPFCGGSKRIPIRNYDYIVPNWIKRCFGREIENNRGQLVLYKNVIYDKLKEMMSMNDGISKMDVACLIHCYLLAVVLCPNQNGSMATHLTVYLENIGSICEYDWCNFVVEMLKNQIVSTKTLKAGGCTMLLLFWVCEHCVLIRPVNEIAFPRFLKWDLKELKDRLQGVNVCDLNYTYIFLIEITNINTLEPVLEFFQIPL